VTRILALDVGTSSARAQVFGDGAVEESPIARREYYGENDPDLLVAAVREVLGEVDAPAAEAVGCSCFGHSLLALDGSGRPLTPVLGWQDTRSAGVAQRLAEALDPAAIHARTGCHVHTSYWPAKLAWLAESDPEVFRAARRFVSFADYLTMQLLGAADVSASASLASGTGLLDLATRTWDDELLETLELDPAQLPRLGDGPLGDWYPAVLDGVCANIGAGCSTRERAALTVGTSAAFRTVHEAAVPRSRPGLFTYLVDDRRVVEGGALSDGGNLNRWIGETLGRSEGSLADRDPDSHGLTFLALLGGERSVGWHLHARGAIAGLTFETTPLDLRQAALEGIAFRLAEIAELMPEVMEVVITGRAILGDDDWLQIVADALARPVIASAVPEASLRGAAVATLERLGLDVGTAPLGRVYEPRPAHAGAFAAARQRQRELYRVAIGAETS
jgi:gluconokinase